MTETKETTVYGRIEPEALLRDIAKGNWRRLIESSTCKNEMTGSLSHESNWWYPKWKDDLLVLEEQIVGQPSSKEASQSSSARGATITCDGESVVLRDEPGYESREDAALVASFIADKLDWRAVVLSGSKEFQQAAKRECNRRRLTVKEIRK